MTRTKRHLDKQIAKTLFTLYKIHCITLVWLKFTGTFKENIHRHTRTKSNRISTTPQYQAAPQYIVHAGELLPLAYTKQLEPRRDSQ